LARTNSAGTSSWYLPDKLGTIRDITDNKAAVLDHVIYDSFGQVTSETNATNGDRFKFAGMEYDSATGQCYDRARDYGSATGRFVSQDPMGLAAGDADLYRYAANGPTDATDPTGLLAMDASDALLLGAGGLAGTAGAMDLDATLADPAKPPDPQTRLRDARIGLRQGIADEAQKKKRAHSVWTLGASLQRKPIPRLEPYLSGKEVIV
jgi:RHS repeat-associated protein